MADPATPVEAPATAAVPKGASPDAPTQDSSEEVSPEVLEEQVKNVLLEEAKKEDPSLTDEVIASWKEHFGKVGIFPIDNRVYFVRPLSRKELRGMAAGEEEGPSQLSQEEKIASMACLYPKMDQAYLSTKAHAGLATTLAEAVHNISNFMPGIQPLIL